MLTSPRSLACSTEGPDNTGPSSVQRRHRRSSTSSLRTVVHSPGGLVRAPVELPTPPRQPPTRTSPSPAPEPRPASHTGPTGPTLRANPCSEVTDPICRLPLPTLVYRPEASDLGDRMRLWVRPDLKLAGNRWDPHTWSNVNKPAAPVTGECGVWGTDSHLSRAGGSTRDATRIVALYGTPCTITLSHSGWLSGSRRLKQKRKLFPGLPPTDASCQAKMPSVTG